MRGSCWPGALFASKTPGTEVVLMAMLPVLATTVPGAGLPAAGLSPAPAELSHSSLGFAVQHPHCCRRSLRLGWRCRSPEERSSRWICRSMLLRPLE